MNWIQKQVANLLNIPVAPTFRPGQQYQIINGQIISSADNKEMYVKTYMVNDIVYSIVHLITEKVRVAPWGVYKVVDDEAYKKLKALRAKKEFTGKEAAEIKNLHKKALEPYEGDKKLLDLVKTPNDTQTFSDLVADSSLFKLLAGGRTIYADTLSDGANKGKPQSLFIIPYQDITLIVDSTWPMKIVGYTLTHWGIKNIDPNKILHDKYYNPQSDLNGAHLYGLAPLKAGLKLFDKATAETTAATASYQNGGPKKIIYLDDIRLDEQIASAQMTAVMGKLKQYEGATNANSFAGSGYKMGAVDLGLSPVDLAIIESQNMTLKQFCNLFGGVPVALLNNTDASTFNNVREAEKALTTRCALPLLNTFRDQFNRMLPKWGFSTDAIVDYDASVYTELQEDQAKKWGWVKELPVTNGYKLDMMGLDHPEGHDEFMDKILVPSSQTTSDDFVQSETDRALEEGDGTISEDTEGADV